MKIALAGENRRIIGKTVSGVDGMIIIGKKG